jgi:hypothetical protein
MNATNNDSKGVELLMEIEAKLIEMKYDEHKAMVKGKETTNPDVRVKMYGEDKGVVSWDKNLPKVLGREVTEKERIRGAVFYMTADGDILKDGEGWPQELQEYVLYADQVIAEKGLLRPTPTVTQEINVRKEADNTSAMQSAKSDSQQLPAIRSELPATVPVQTQTGMTVVNKNAPTAVRVNDIDIPNEYIVWYATRQNGKLVGAKPYIVEKGLEYLAGRLGLWTDPRASDPAVPVEQLNGPVGYKVIKYPWTENDMGPKGVCIVEGIVRMANGQVFTDIGTVTPDNTNTMQKKYPLENAITRAKARALRSATQCNICSLEEADIQTSGDKVLVRGAVPNQNGEIIDAEFTVVN